MKTFPTQLLHEKWVKAIGVVGITAEQHLPPAPAD
jgi:hypothetical protein